MEFYPEDTNVNFVHLHNHTEFSLLDGMSKIPELVSAAKRYGMKALAITDHGNMFGAIKFYNECKKQGIKPIIGCEVYLAEKRKEDKSGSNYHLVLLAKNMEGYKNLCKIVSDAYTSGFYYKPRTDHKSLRKHSSGLIALSGCLAGKVQKYITEGDIEKATEEALLMNEIFGEGNFYMELQNHNLSDDKRAIEGILEIHNKTGIPMVATNDAHYVSKEDSKAHDILMCLQTNSTINDENRFTFETTEFYLKSPAEMSALFSKYEGAIENSCKIADMCNFEFEFGKYHIPSFPVPAGFKDTHEFFRHLCNKGFNERYSSDRADIDELRKRLEYEVSVIEKMGYVEYFLIVWDYINFAKTHGVAVGPGRGSAAGSIVSYSLAITDLDPIKYGLIFERFLNPERISMPDIDTDFGPSSRYKVIDYVTQKYGRDSVCQISTFNAMKAKGVIRDVGRAIGVKYSEMDSVAKLIPDDPNITIEQALSEVEELKRLYNESPEIRTVIKMALKLEGTSKSVGTHAAGVVIAPDSVKNFMPLVVSKKGLATMYDKDEVEGQGILKMDFLGLRNLEVIEECIESVKKNKGVDIDISKIPLDDENVYNMISKGKTTGVFQLESKGITDCMKKLKPSCFEDIIAGIALYRPGPMDSIPTYIENKKHPDKISYIDPHLEPILNVTYGCIVYQEQVMQVVRELAGYSYGRSDLVRRYMSKKKTKEMEAEREYFINGKLDDEGNIEIAGCVRNGIDKDVANKIYDDMIAFAQYAFNKSHAAAYAIITYQTAWLRYYYPVEFMAALMSNAPDTDHLHKYIKDAGKIMITLDTGKRKKIKVVPPDINQSFGRFSPQNDGRILFGLHSIKGVSDAGIDAAVNLREDSIKYKNKDWRFNDIYDFVEAIPIECLKSETITALAKCGAMSSITPTAKEIVENSDAILSYARKKKRSQNSMQVSLFDLMPSVQETTVRPNIILAGEYSNVEMSMMEKECLGFYLSKHPLKGYLKDIEELEKIRGEELDEKINSALQKSMVGSARNEFSLIGFISSIKEVKTKKSGRKMAFLTVETEAEYSYDIAVFPETYDIYRNDLAQNKIITLKMFAQKGGLILDTCAEGINRELLLEDGRKNLKYLKISCSSKDIMEINKVISRRYSGGSIKVLWYNKNENSNRPRILPVQTRYDKVLYLQIKDMIGEENVKFS